MTRLSRLSLLGRPFSAAVAEIDGVVVLRLAGEFDMAAASEVGETFYAACSHGGETLAVDLSAVTFMDAGGLCLLIAAHNRLVGEGRGGLSVRGTSRIVRRIFEITQTTALLDHPDQTLVTSGVLPATWRHRRVLDVARREAGVSVTDLFVAYFALGGTAERGQLIAYLGGDTTALDVHEQDVAIHALNERLIDLGRNDRQLAYASDHS